MSNSHFLLFACCTHAHIFRSRKSKEKRPTWSSYFLAVSSSLRRSNQTITQWARYASTVCVYRICMAYIYDRVSMASAKLILVNAKKKNYKPRNKKTEIVSNKHKHFKKLRVLHCRAYTYYCRTIIHCILQHAHDLYTQHIHVITKQRKKNCTLPLNERRNKNKNRANNAGTR